MLTRATAEPASLELHGDRPAMQDSLERCVGDVERFLAERWGRRPHRHHGGGFADLLSLEDVDRLVASSALREPAFRLVRDGRTLPRSRVARAASVGSRPIADLLDPDKVFAELDAGATIVLQGVHRYWPAVTRFCRGLEQVLSQPVQANAYVTPPSAQGLHVHRDRHDVFAVHTYGAKRWVVHADGEAAAPTMDDEVHAGECLYLPVGTPHAARTERSPSIHLAIGVPCRTWGSLLRPVVEQLLASGRLAERLPAGYATDPTAAASLGEEAATLLHELAAALGEVDPAPAADAARDAFWRSRPPLRDGQLTSLLALDALDDDTTVRRRRWTRCAVEVADDAVLLRLPDRALRFPARTRAVLEQVAAADHLRVGDLAEHLDSRGRLTLVRRLVREGLLVVEPTDTDRG